MLKKQGFYRNDRPFFWYQPPELGTANLHSIPQNCKRCSATTNPQVCDRFAVTFRTSATANAHCTSANLEYIIYCYFVLVMIFFTFGGQILRSIRRWPRKKKVINPENKSVHSFQAVLPRNRQHCLLLCGRKLGSQIETWVRNLWICGLICRSAHLCHPPTWR